MKSFKSRFVMVVALLSAFTALPMAAHSALVNPVTTSDGSVIGGGDWTSGVSLGWSITDTGSAYEYSYSFEAPDPALSHFILQTSGNFTYTNIIEIFPDRYELGTFSDSDGSSNPSMPEPVFGIKFEGFEEGTSFTMTLLSDRAPMEGDFYAKGGDDSFAYNSGYGQLDGANILVPDTVTHRVPEPGTLLLLGSGLFGIAGWGRKRFRK